MAAALGEMLLKSFMVCDPGCECLKGGKDCALALGELVAGPGILPYWDDREEKKHNIQHGTGGYFSRSYMAWRRTVALEAPSASTVVALFLTLSVVHIPALKAFKLQPKPQGVSGRGAHQQSKLRKWNGQELPLVCEEGPGRPLPAAISPVSAPPL